MYKRLITTSRGIAPTLKRELKYLRYKPFHQFDTGVFLEAPLTAIGHLNVRLRTASKVWLILQEKDSVHTFEDLFQLVASIDWTQRIAPGTPITVQANSYKSDLSSQRTVQSITHKSILTALTGEADATRSTDPAIPPAQIRITIAHNSCSVAINTSGNALHQRGRRQDTGEAPLKEHIAAALILMTSWGYSSPLIDPMCGSGTLPIEAALIASNRAPGLSRSFAFQTFPCLTSNDLEQVKQQARDKIFHNDYQIHGYDIDKFVLDTARNNAQRAGVDQLVTFSHRALQDTTFANNDTVITNPPYGKRIGQDTVHQIHQTLFDIAPNVKNMTIITGYPRGGDFVDNSTVPRKEIICLNGADECGILIRQ